MMLTIYTSSYKCGGGWWHSLYGAIMTFTENPSTADGGVAECASPRVAVADQEGT